MYPACPKKVVKSPEQDLAVLFKVQQGMRNSAPSPVESSNTNLKRQAIQELSHNKRQKSNRDLKN